MTRVAMSSAFEDLRQLFVRGGVAGLGDESLLRRYASARDAEAFEALVTRHGPMVLATCRAVLRREQDVEDAFQATFVVLADKAGSVRAGDALGGWLHRVAYRIAVQASVRDRRRRRHESGELTVDIPSPATDAPEPDLGPALHDEIDRLPRRQRLPLVLCDLEGLSYPEAARRLRVSVPALRSRLARGRERLRARLARKGFAHAAIAPALALESSRASVPASWVAAAVAASAGAPASTAVALLSRSFLRGILMTQAKLATTAILVVASLAMAGAFARVEEEKPLDAKMGSADVASKAKTKAPAPAAPAPTSTDQIHLRGRVVDMRGQPVPNAKLVFPLEDLDHPDVPFPESSTGPDGRFSTSVPIHWAGPVVAEINGEFSWVIAFAPGFGPNVAKADLQTARNEELTVRLVDKGLPIEGRVVDLEGRPVAGARVRVKAIHQAEKIGLETWLKDFEAGRHFNIGGDLEFLQVNGPETATDRDGRFRLTDIGAESFAEVCVSGPTIATTMLYIATREGNGKHPSGIELRRHDLIVYDRRAEFVAMPTKPIEGVIRDKDTGRPIPEVTLQAAILDNPGIRPFPVREVTARTDREGRYRLKGLPRAGRYNLFIEPGPGLPYTRSIFEVQGGSPSLDPIRFDVGLKRGILVRGRLTDKATGKPAVGHVEAFSFRDNPRIREYPGYLNYTHTSMALVGRDGYFEIATIPGRGIIAAQADPIRYRKGIGADAIKGPKHNSGFDTAPIASHGDDFSILAEVDLDPGADSATLDLQVDPGRTVAIQAVDPEGKPIGRNKVSGLGNLSSTTEYDRRLASFEVHALNPSQPRRLTVANVERKLIGSAYLKGDEPSPLTLRLQPWGTITGRVVDDQGRTRRGLHLYSPNGPDTPTQEAVGFLPERDWNGGLFLGDDGRFRIEGLVPGLKYGADVSENFGISVHLIDGIILAPGEVKDLGDVKFVPAKP